MKPEPIKHPRKVGKHVAAAIDMLVDAGATDIRVYKTRHIKVEFMVGRRAFSVQTACTPRDENNCLRHFEQAVRSRLARAVAEMNA